MIRVRRDGGGIERRGEGIVTVAFFFKSYLGSGSGR